MNGLFLDTVKDLKKIEELSNGTRPSQLMLGNNTRSRLLSQGSALSLKSLFMLNNLKSLKYSSRTKLLKFYGYFMLEGNPPRLSI